MKEYKFDAKSVKQRIIEWTKDYFAAQSLTQPEIKAVIGISGGKDSSVSAALCAEALGKEHVFGVLMPQGEQFDIDVSRALCKHLGIDYVEINIGDTVERLYDAFADSSTKISLPLNDAVKFNTPSRIRMSVLYAIAASVNGRVANNSNLSELYVGWGTKFGDTAGDFSLISDLTVTEVKAVGRELYLPDKFIDKTPIDGLCGKTDEEGLGFSYDTLDRYIRTGECDDKSTLERIIKLHDISGHKRQPVPSFKII
ncbi:MAG: NAD(+) synthase [Oscillospiraceae bacterium]|nr:NAD(+) synthase [Oscillospiraceae bacterium]